MPFLPISQKDCQDRGIEQLDFIYVIGDAYVDHPSFGHAIISRVLESFGYSVGIISQPDWKNPDSITVLGEPRLGFLVSGGNMDSMVNHYYVSKKPRTADAYTPGGIMGKRPDHAAVVYSNLIRQRYKNTPVILGGIEASLRRMAHYDYWSDSFKRSILLDSGADLISYGMGEKSIVEIADALNSGIDVKDITFIKGTVYKTKDIGHVQDGILLPSYEQMKKEKSEYAFSFNIQYENTDPFSARSLIEPYDHGIFVVQNAPSMPLSAMEMDDIYDLPYMRTYHPSYEEAGGVPALSEVRFSLISNRGCFGGCTNRQCLFPKLCPNLEADHTDYIRLLRKLRKLPGVKKVFIRSGIRFDYLLCDKSDTFFHELLQYHVSGQLKVAPEHISNEVLSKMGKPENRVYEQFVRKYEAYNKKIGKKQYVVPYFMSSHPGSTLKEAIALAEYIRDLGYMPEQVQDFYPTPSTISTVMYYTGLDPRDQKPVYVVKNPHEKAMQRALIQYRNPENYQLVKEALILAHREDLIGFGNKCLIPPRKLKESVKTIKNKKKGRKKV